jgi:hypothetical protein
MVMMRSSDLSKSLSESLSKRQKIDPSVASGHARLKLSPTISSTLP